MRRARFGEIGRSVRSPAGARWGAVFALLTTTHVAASSAYANGAFPSSGQILVDPGDPSTIWVRTTYGFARTSDGGTTFQLVCEEAMGYSSGFHPTAAISPTGALFMGVSDGLVVGRGDTCSFERAPELEGSFVVDVSIDPNGRAIALVAPPDAGRARVFVSTDDLATWQQLGDVLPEKITPLTLDAAATNPDVVYVSALADGPSGLGLLITTEDGGATWSSQLIPGSDSQVRPFIAAVDPLLQERVYVRLTGIPGRLLMSEDYGASFDLVLQTDNGLLQAFRLVSDGSMAYFGGVIDGLKTFEFATSEVTDVTSIAARCVTLHDDDIFACADVAFDGYSAARSTDGGATFQPFLVNQCIEGIIPCDEGLAVHDLCEPAWPAIEAALGAQGDCDGVGGSGAGVGSSGTGGTNQGAAPPMGGSTPTGSAATGAGGAASDSEDGGCACILGRGTARASPAWIALALLLAARRCARRH